MIEKIFRELDNSWPLFMGRGIFLLTGYSGADSCKVVPSAVLRCIVDEIVPIDAEVPIGNNNDSLRVSEKKKEKT